MCYFYVPVMINQYDSGLPFLDKTDDKYCAKNNIFFSHSLSLLLMLVYYQQKQRNKLCLVLKHHRLCEDVRS